MEHLRQHFDGLVLVLPGRTRIRTKEGIGAVDEAIRFLRSVPPLSALMLSNGMCRAAADHCAEQVGGEMGHAGRSSRNPADRINRYGSWSGAWGENIAYGKSTARDVVLALIIDDGLRGRKHRKNIFNPGFSFAGAAFGAHATYGSVCSIDFTGSYTDRGAAGDEKLLARNF